MRKIEIWLCSNLFKKIYYKLTLYFYLLSKLCNTDVKFRKAWNVLKFLEEKFWKCVKLSRLFFECFTNKNDNFLNSISGFSKSTHWGPKDEKYEPIENTLVNWRAWMLFCSSRYLNNFLKSSWQSYLNFFKESWLELVTWLL